MEQQEGVTASAAPSGSTVSLIEYNQTMASLHVAEHAVREEPYPRLPVLAGTLAITAMRFKQLRQEAMELRAELTKWQTTRCRCIKTQLDEAEMPVKYGVMLVNSDGSESGHSLRWRDWDDAAAFGETEVREKRACGFRIFSEPAV